MLDNPIYKEIGVVPVIHAAGTKTTHGGTQSPPEVFKAMELASKSFVNIEELNRKVGEYIAEITGAEAGMVTSGAASGVVLSIAACMTGTDIVKIRKLPNATGMKSELILQKIHAGSYSHMYTFAGAKLIEVGDINNCLPDELESAINEKTVAINYLLGPRISRAGLSLKQVSDIAHKHNLPVIVDAAAMLPPKSNLRRYIDEGADLVTISGGKMIHGPQGAGLLFGKKDLIDAAFSNASPNHAIGRPHKVSREEIVGLYTALKLFMENDEELMFIRYREKLKLVSEQLDELEELRLEIVHDQINYNVPVLTIQFNEKWKGPSPSNIPKTLLQGNPRIFMQYFKELDQLVVNPVSLQESEPEIVGKMLKNLFLHYRKINFCKDKRDE